MFELGAGDALFRTWSGSEDSSHKKPRAGVRSQLAHLLALRCKRSLCAGFLFCSYCSTPVGFTVQDIVKEETADIHVSKVDLHRRLYHSLCRPRRSARSQLFQVQTRYPFLDAVFTRILVEYWPSSQVPVQAIFSRLVPLFPRPELEEVQKGTTVFPVKSLFLMKLFTTHEASYHQIG